MPAGSKYFFNAALASQLRKQRVKTASTAGKRSLRVVMGNLAVDVMKDVRLGDSMGRMSTDPAHDAAAVAE